MEVNWLKALHTPGSQLTPSLPSDWLPVAPLGSLRTEKKEGSCWDLWPGQWSNAAFMSYGNKRDLEALKRHDLSLLKLAAPNNYSYLFFPPSHLTDKHFVCVWCIGINVLQRTTQFNVSQKKEKKNQASGCVFSWHFKVIQRIID